MKKCECGHSDTGHHKLYGYCKVIVRSNGYRFPCRCNQFTEKPKKQRPK